MHSIFVVTLPAFGKEVSLHLQKNQISLCQSSVLFLKMLPLMQRLSDHIFSSVNLHLF